MPSHILLSTAHVCTSHALRHVATLIKSLLERNDRGQTTAEYGLVVLAAGTLALAAIVWARSSGSITSLFETVINTLTGDIG